MSIGENIKRIRIEKGLTQKKLGELCGINEANIRKYELRTGNAKPKYDTLKKIANALEVPIFYLDTHIEFPEFYTEYYKIVFSENLNYFLKLNNKSASDLAKEIGIQESAVRQWCNGIQVPIKPSILELARYFKTDYLSLIEEKITPDSHQESTLVHNIGKKIVERRKNLHLSQPELGLRLGIDTLDGEEIVNSIEFGNIPYITPRKLNALSKALNTTSQYLLGEFSEPIKNTFLLSDDEKNLLTNYRKLNIENKTSLINYVIFMLSNQ